MKEINRRFKILYGMLGFSSAAGFAAELGVHRAYLNQIYINGLNPSFIKTLVSRFPQINIDFLETGEGDPLLPAPPLADEDIQRAGQVQLIVDILQKLDPPTLRIILEAIEKYKDTPHYRRLDPADDKPEKKSKKK